MANWFSNTLGKALGKAPTVNRDNRYVTSNRRSDFYGLLNTLKSQAEKGQLNPQNYQNQLQTTINTYGPSSGLYGATNGEAISPQEIQASLNSIYGIGGQASGGAASYGGGGGGTDYSGVYRNQINALRPTLDSLYNQIYGGLNQQAAQATNEAQDAFNTNQQNLTNNYLGNVNRNAAAYTANNAYDSSFRGNAEDAIKTDYQAQGKTNQQALDKNLSAIGSSLNQQRSGLQQPDWNAIGSAQDATSLGNYLQQLQGLEGNWRQSLAGLGSNQFYQDLAKNTGGYTNSQSQSVSDQLTKLAGAAAPANNKQIAAGSYISQLPSTNDKEYWQNYFDNLVKQSAPQGR